jgi:hypothetical protein
MRQVPSIGSGARRNNSDMPERLLSFGFWWASTDALDGFVARAALELAR